MKTWHNATWSFTDAPDAKLTLAVKRDGQSLAGQTISEQGAAFARTIGSRLPGKGKPRIDDEEDDGEHGASLEQNCDFFKT